MKPWRYVWNSQNSHEKSKRVELLVQSEKIRFSTREEAADLKVRLFTSLRICPMSNFSYFQTWKLDRRRRKSSAFAMARFFSTQRMGWTLKKEAKFTAKGKKARDLLSAGFLTTLDFKSSSRLNQWFFDLENQGGKNFTWFFSHPKIFFMVGIPTFQAMFQSSKWQLSQLPYHILTKNHWFFCGFTTPENHEQND